MISDLNLCEVARLNGAIIKLRVTHSMHPNQIADRLNLDPEYVTRVLKAREEEDYPVKTFVYGGVA